MKDSVSFDLDVKNAGINIIIAFGESEGKPTIHSEECSASVDSVDIKLHGGKSWLYNLFHDKIGHVIKDKLQSLLCEEANKAVDNDADEALAKAKLVASIGKTGVVDYHMLSDPIFRNGYVESYHKGEILWPGSHKEVPFHPKMFPQSYDTSKMAYIWVSGSLMNTASYMLQKQGILQYYLRPQDLKPNDWHYLDTTCLNKQCLGNFIVNLKDDFPNSQIYINMSTYTAPTFSITNGQIFGKIQGTMKYFVQLPNKSPKCLFNTAVTANVSLTASVHDQKITAKVSSFTPSVTVTNTEIGRISGPALTSVFQILSDIFIIPKLNELGAEGLPLPGSKQVAFENPSLNLVENAIMLGTDLVWNPKLNVNLNKKAIGVDRKTNEAT